MLIHFDFSNMMAERLGNSFGIDPGSVSRLAPRVAACHAALQEARLACRLGWTQLPYDRHGALEVADYARRVRDTFDTFVVLGIGGSALGGIALHAALNHPFYNLLPRSKRGPQMFFVDNVDPDLNAGMLEMIDLEHTLFNVVTKSGSTAETMSQFLIVSERLRQRLGGRYRDNVVVTTDPEKGALRRLAEEEGYRSFSIPPGVGGRFSVLSPVGLLPAAVSGIDILELLAGAVSADEHCRQADPWRNIAYMNAVLQYIAYTEQGRRIVVMMPYCQALFGIADWFRQLWAESLGKRHRRDGSEVRVGPTPVKALGTTDQHSQVQLYVEGPSDKVVNFLAVEKWRSEVRIPAAALEGLEYLGDHTLGELTNAERQATEIALANAGQSSATLSLPEVSPFTIGQLIYLLEIQTALSGELYDINAFDQPGVEAGKVATYALMGRKGYEQRRNEIEDQRAQLSKAYRI